MMPPGTRIFSSLRYERPLASIGANSSESIGLVSPRLSCSRTFEHIKLNGFDKVISKVSEKVRLAQRTHNSRSGFSMLLIQVFAAHLVNTLSEVGHQNAIG